MKFISYRIGDRASYGAVIDDQIADLGCRPDAPADLKAAIAASWLPGSIKGLEPTLALAEVSLLPIIPNPGKILCVGHNYEDHRKETNRAKTDHPSIFTRFADTQIAAGEAIRRPPESTMLDYEGELLLIVGKGGRRISREDAMDHVAGFACANDASIRDFQWHTGQFTPGKNFPGTCASGPWMVTTDEIGPLEMLSITTRLNGEVMQQGRFDQLVFPIPELVAYCSTFTNLSPGDLILTGTPGGVGAKRQPPVWMKAGDTVEITIDAIGTLTNPVIDEA
ncbi:fumarylacetoacetate hydrolase family protein [Sphingomonas sp. BAUL-RG-20F-R05-02]|uniref:fumarylacetoacetate hydrolase family protein n=1 Tax=Sphingomonas sp. BAUL-RG-20F-R05-02 TaxID=2914830 RepID=UPI001F5979C8|nr:fumarylacetoacetate hydrolase family protein [Sphingomonas sp. BAUL-RG-20F-R05-02]